MYLYMGDPIKINFLNYSDGNIVPKYYIFSEHNSDITQIFDKDELKYIKQQNIDVQHIEKSIHLDDTTDIIKRKIRTSFRILSVKLFHKNKSSGTTLTNKTNILSLLFKT